MQIARTPFDSPFNPLRARALPAATLRDAPRSGPRAWRRACSPVGPCLAYRLDSRVESHFGSRVESRFDDRLERHDEPRGDPRARIDADRAVGVLLVMVLAALPWLATGG
jgi:hypothetical protein